MGGSRGQDVCLDPKSLQFVVRCKRLHRALFKLPDTSAAAGPAAKIDGAALAQLLAGVAIVNKRGNRLTNDLQ